MTEMARVFLKQMKQNPLERGFTRAIPPLAGLAHIFEAAAFNNLPAATSLNK